MVEMMMISSVRRDWERIYEDERIARRGCAAKYVPLSKSLVDSWNEGESILKSICSNSNQCTVVDYGCGSFGMTIIPAARRGLHATGVDISARALSLLRNRVKAMKVADKVDLILGSVTALPIRADIFDAGVCSSVIMHVDAPRALSEMARTVRRKGRIWIDSWLNKYHLDNLQVIVAMLVFRMLGRKTSVPLRYYSLREIKTLLRLNDLKVITIQCSQRLPLPFSYRAIIPKRLKLFSTNRLFRLLSTQQLAHRFSIVVVRF